MIAQKWDEIWINAKVLTMEKQMDVIPQGALAVKDKKIAWVGSMESLPANPLMLASVVHDMEGRCLTPGFIDCHTHLVYAGSRAHEFEMRLKGMSYEAIAQAGGGILSTVKATREASEAQLLKESLKRAKALSESGVTLLEIKSGYGLDLATELKMLKVAKQIEDHLPLTVCRTFLGAHSIPPEYKQNADDYVEIVCEEMMPLIARQKSAEAVDVFCESIAFSLAQTERIFKTAKQLGLSIKCHGEQLSHSGSAQLAAQHQALSVDHLEYASVNDIEALAKSETVAVLLPGAFYYLREKKLPPVDELRRQRVPIAIASDCNPGTSPVLSILLIMNMACQLFRLTLAEAFQGVTKHAARALGRLDEYGTLKVGKTADFLVWDVEEVSDLIYYSGNNPLWSCIKNGLIVQT